MSTAGEFSAADAADFQGDVARWRAKVDDLAAQNRRLTRELEQAREAAEVDEVGPPAVRLVPAGLFNVGSEGPFCSAWLELDGRQLAASSFIMSSEDFAALNEALGNRPPLSRRGVRRYVADRIAADIMTVRDRFGREWFRLAPGEARWSRLDYLGHWTEGELVFDAGHIDEVPDIAYTLDVDGKRVRTER